MARSCGSWMVWVLLSLSSALSVALGMVTEKLLLLRWVNSLSVGELVVVVVPVPLVLLPLLLLLLLLLLVVAEVGACRPMLKLVGGSRPRSWARSRLTCRMRTSTTTSGGA